MSSTITLESTLDWAQAFLKFQPIDVEGGSLEPFLTNANMVLQTIVGPPFRWAWNRATTTFTTAAGTQDYNKAVSDFGFIEKAWFTNGTTTKEIPGIRMVLGGSLEQLQPNAIAAQLNDNAGNITFRLNAAADAIYTVTVAYQKKPALMTSLASTWAPIPDEYGYLYNRGFLAAELSHGEDPRAQMEGQKFAAALLGASEGLDETQKNAFLEGWGLAAGQVASHQQRIQQGGSARLQG